MQFVQISKKITKSVIIVTKKSTFLFWIWAKWRVASVVLENAAVIN